jgi:hypothetical protein
MKKLILTLTFLLSFSSSAFAEEEKQYTKEDVINAFCINNDGELLFTIGEKQFNMDAESLGSLGISEKELEIFNSLGDTAQRLGIEGDIPLCK